MSLVDRYSKIFIQISFGRFWRLRSSMEIIADSEFIWIRRLLGTGPSSSNGFMISKMKRNSTIFLKMESNKVKSYAEKNGGYFLTSASRRHRPVTIAVDAAWRLASTVCLFTLFHMNVTQNGRWFVKIHSYLGYDATKITENFSVAFSWRLSQGFIFSMWWF